VGAPTFVTSSPGKSRFHGYDGAMAIQFDPELTRFYLRALLAVARADREIDAAEGVRLDAVIQRRFPGTDLGDVMFDGAIRTDELSKALGAEVEGGPFRNFKIDPKELARMFVEDAIAISDAKDGMSSVEEATLTRYASVFGMPAHEVRAALSKLP
jgi:tellurite resistance protein